MGIFINIMDYMDGGYGMLSVLNIKALSRELLQNSKRRSNVCATRSTDFPCLGAQCAITRFTELVDLDIFVHDKDLHTLE